MARRFDTHYKAKRLDNLGDASWHDRRWADVDARLHARELDSTAIEGTIDTLRAVALQRLHDSFTPLIEQAQQQLADVGVSFTGHSLSTHTIGMGAKTFMIVEQQRAGFVVVDYASIRPTGVTTASMICSVLSYDRPTGTLVVEPQLGYVTGSGTYSDWQIGVSVTPNLDTYSREETENRLATALVRSNNLSDIPDPVAARAALGLGDINNTSDFTKPVSAPQQAAIDAVVAATLPVGTSMIFYQAAVPPGWIRLTTQHDKGIRVVNTSGGSSGGVQPWSTIFNRQNVDNFTLNTNTIPSHSHAPYDPTHAHSIADYTHTHYLPYAHNHDVWGGGLGYYNIFHNYFGAYVNYSGASVAVYGAGTGVSSYAAGGGAPHAHGLDLRCQYVDVIIGVKA